MLIRFLGSIADRTGWSYDYGEVAEVPDDRAAVFLANGQAEAVQVVCPHCGGDLGLVGGETVTATANPSGARATLPRAAKRGG